MAIQIGFRQEIYHFGQLKIEYGWAWVGNNCGDKVRNMVLEVHSKLLSATQCWVGGKDELYTMVGYGMKAPILDEDIYTVCSPN